MLLEIDFANKKKRPPPPPAKVLPIHMANGESKAAVKPKAASQSEHITLSI